MNHDAVVPNMPPAVDPGSAADAIRDHLAPMEVLGDVHWHAESGMWRAFVAVRPSGPMLLMSFRVSIRPA